MIHLRSVALPAASARRGRRDDRGFSFDLPAIRGLRTLTFESPVTIFVGENGSGKSTLLEALAIAAHSTTAGTAEAAADPSLDHVRTFARALKLTWAHKPGRGFYLRAEDFFGFARRVAEMRSGLERELARVEEEYADASETAKTYARTPYLRELAELRRRYGEGLDTQSHGESFLRFFQARFVPGGLYFLDEPEAPLSPSRQLSFLTLLKELVDSDAQVILATHSPILLAFPGAAIWNFDSEPLRPVAYEDLEHVTLTRDFLANPEAFLRHL